MKSEYEMQQLLGQESTEDIIEWFAGETYENILAEIERCWPQEEGNKEFAEEVKEFVNLHQPA